MVKKRMKIMFCLGSMSRGGAERVVANLSNFFSKENDVSIVVTRHDKIGYEIDKNVKYYSLDNVELARGGLMKRTLRRIYRMHKILKEESPDVVVSFLPEPSYRMMLAKIGIKTRTIISIRNDPNVEYNSVIKRMLVKLLYTPADGFVFQTPDAQRWFSKKIQKKSVVIPNPVDESFVLESYAGKRYNRIVSVGRLVEQKNHVLLIDAFGDFCRSHDGYVLEIYGDGPLKKQLQSHIEEMGLNDKIKLMGEVNNVKNAIRNAKMFVLSSNYEGMPNALMEAMALGLPCASTNCPIGGPKMLIKNNVNGILVKVGDIGEMAKAMEKIADNEKFADEISRGARNLLANKYSPTKINNEWADFVREKGI